MVEVRRTSINKLFCLITQKTSKVNGKKIKQLWLSVVPEKKKYHKAHKETNRNRTHVIKICFFINGKINISQSGKALIIVHKNLFINP